MMVEPFVNRGRRGAQSVVQVCCGWPCGPCCTFENRRVAARHEGAETRCSQAPIQKIAPTGMKFLGSKPLAKARWWALVRKMCRRSTRATPPNENVTPPQRTLNAARPILFHGKLRAVILATDGSQEPKICAAGCDWVAPTSLLHAPRMPIAPPPTGFHGPVKRSVTIAGHPTSISLEPAFWRVLEAAAGVRALPLNALIAEIDALRIQSDDPPNLASALRSWLLEEYIASNSQ